LKDNNPPLLTRGLLPDSILFVTGPENVSDNTRWLFNIKEIC